MSSERFETTTHTEFDAGVDDTRATVQLLVSDTGNRTVIRKMLEEYFDVETGQTVQDADLYLIEDHLFPEYHETLREQVEGAHPVFCPVVLLRRETTDLAHPTSDAASHEGPMLIDDVVEAPVDKTLLIRRLHSLLVRRRQSQELSNHVSTLERREQELRRFERGVESTGNGIVMTNRFGEIEYVNPAFEGITGYAEAEVLGETPRVLQPAGAADVFTEEFWRTMVDREEWAGEVVIEHSDERRSVVDTSITATHDDDGEVEGFVVVMADITERIQQEEELRRHEEELEHLRQILTRYLRHNLRNDLNIILGYGEMLVADETLSDSQRQKVEKVVETAQRLEGMSETARKYSTLLQRDTELSSHDLTEIVTGAVQKIRDEYPDVEFDIEIPESCDVRARAEIRDAIQELIENAAKHADPVSPDVHIHVDNANRTRVVIEDNGSGIPDLEVEALDEGAETPLSHSQGIGLWLSKWLIESFDGQLSFELLDPGTRVVVEFPPSHRSTSRELDIPTLKEREQRLQTVIDRMTDAIVEVNASWEVTFMDPRAEEILDVSADQAQGEELWDVLSELQGTELEAVHREVMVTRSSQHVEAYFAGIDRWVSVYVYPEFDGGISFYFQDTTERNRREQELQQARSRMELALRVTDSTVWEWDVETDSATFHPEVHAAFGARISTGDEFLSSIHPDDQAQVRDALETAVETGAPYSAEFRVQRGDGLRWIEDYGEVRRDEETDSKRLIGIARDITERKRREQELERTQELLKHKGRIADVGSWEIDTETMDVFWSENLFRILGVNSDDEPPLEEALDVYHEEDRPVVESAVENALETGEPFDVEARFRRPDGDLRWLRIQGTPTIEDGEVVTLRGAVQDITEYKKLEADLRRERDLVEGIVETSPIGISVVDADGTLTFANERAEAIYGRSSETVEDFTHDDPRWELVNEGGERFDAGTTPFERVVSREEPIYDHVLSLRQPSGDRVWLSVNGAPQWDDEGNLQRVIFAFEDITEQRELETRVSEILGRVTDAFYALDDEFRFTHVNERAEELLQASEAELLGESLWEQYPEAAEIDEVWNAFHAAMETQVPQSYETYFEPLEFRVEATVYPSESGVSVYFRDVTDQRAYEREIEEKNDRLEEFARAVSHDLRNPLNVARGRLALAEEFESENLETAKDALDRMERIIEDMLWLVREGKVIGSTAPVELSGAVGSSWAMVEGKRESDDVVLQDELGEIEADDDRLCQLLENLFRNSVEHSDEAVTVRVGALDSGFYVEDTGRGIPEDDREKVFEVGYTTSSDGTGFGLSIVNQIADAHGWEVTITEGTTGGARFEITGVEIGSE